LNTEESKAVGGGAGAKRTWGKKGREGEPNQEHHVKRLGGGFPPRERQGGLNTAGFRFGTHQQAGVHKGGTVEVVNSRGGDLQAHAQGDSENKKLSFGQKNRILTQ